MKMSKVRTGLFAFAATVIMGAAPMTVFAQVPQCICEEKCVEDVKDGINEDCVICIEDISMCEGVEAEPEEEVIEEVYGPLTPDGNLTLVDDYGTLEAGGKQFITVVSKSGNYFYIIIDRDDKGTETVHFLNMVDEADLLKLMDDEEVKQYMDATAEKEDPVDEPVVEEPTEKEPEQEAEPEKPQKNNASKYLGLMFLAGIGAVGGYVFFMKKKKGSSKKKSDVDPDQDDDEDEDYLAGLNEDEDEIIDSDIEEDFEDPEEEDSEEE